MSKSALHSQHPQNLTRLRTFYSAASLILLISALMSAPSWSAQQLTIYTYHDKPPYFTQTATPSDEANELMAKQIPNTQLYRAFIDMINSQQQVWRLELVHLPRKRLDLLLKAKTLRGAVIGVNPSWFKDGNKQRYLWSAAFMHDKDVVVVSEDSSIPYLHPEDLAGKTLALQRGFYFWGITERANAGKIEVLETTSDEQNLKLVAIGRVDATIMSSLTFKYFQENEKLDNKLVALDEPHDRFTRHLMFTQHVPTAYDQLADTIESISKSPAWRAKLASYR